jgi:hypothetical protein
VSNIPDVNQYQDEQPFLATREHIAGAYWSLDWRDIYPVASDRIRNHTTPAFLGVLDGTESVTDWNPWEGVTGPHPRTVIRHGYGTPGIQEFPNDAPLAIDSFDRHPDHGQNVLSGVSSIAALVPFLELPDAGIGTNDLGNGYETPYHFDYGLQVDMASAISPRQVFREPPSYGDQSAAVYAAGL